MPYSIDPSSLIFVMSSSSQLARSIMESSSPTADFVSHEKSGPTPLSMLPDMDKSVPPPEEPSPKKYNSNYVAKLIKKNHIMAMDNFSKIIKKQDDTMVEIKVVQEEQKRVRKQYNRKYQDKLKVEKVKSLNTIQELRKRLMN